MVCTSSCYVQITIGGALFYIEMSYVYLVNHFDIFYNKRENEICFSEWVRAY